MRTLIESIKIHARPETVWSALEDFGDVAAWAPYMRVSHLLGTQSSGAGTRRAMQHELGFRFEEAVTAWREGEGYDFDVLRAPWPMKNVKEIWNMAAAADGVRVTTRVDYDMELGPLGRLADVLMVRYIVKREMRSGIRGLKAYVERLPD
ncbi:MAG: SRPBCC family protein [Gammaproteobacteria bacterium]|nr:SRPBCC family protein [Gammaproteobacteria bacterium]MBT8051979.1 SRPBCC family protein [Gammaproteobacteria bacterium]MBT8055877.1 SRPBCC family protein [Gammaproteobacteria bacterium]